MAEATKEDAVAPIDLVFNGQMQELLTEAKSVLGCNEGEYTMFIADLPNSPPDMPSVVMVAQANSNQQTATKREHILGVCQLVEMNRSGQADIFPVITANGYFNTPDTKINSVTATISVIQQSKHGRLEPDSGGSWTGAKYLPNEGYLGQDSFVMQVEGSGYTVKLHYFVLVTDSDGVSPLENPDCKNYSWKISLINNTLDTLTLQPPLSHTGIDRSINVKISHPRHAPPAQCRRTRQQLQTDFDLQVGETDMIILDMPTTPPQQAPMILVAAASAPASTKELYGTVGICVVEEKAERVKTGDEIINALHVSNTAWQLFRKKFPGFELKGANTETLAESGEGPDFMAFDADGGKITVLQSPKHGTLSTVPTDYEDFYYHPKSEYVGKDKAIFLVNLEGFKIKVVYYFNVVADYNFMASDRKSFMLKYCPDPSIWQISLLNNPPMGTLTLQPLLSYTGIGSPINVAFSNLAGGAVGSTQGTTITLAHAQAASDCTCQPQPSHG